MLKNSYSFIQRKRVHFEKEEEESVCKMYEGGNIGANEVEEEKDKEENMIGGRKVTISFLLYFFTNCFM